MLYARRTSLVALLSVLAALPRAASATACSAASLTENLSGNFFAAIHGPGMTACESVAAGQSCSVICRNGFEGGAVVCNAATGAFVVEGCTAIPNHCADDALEVEGAHFSKIGGVFTSQVTEATCDGTPALDLCVHVCAEGYTGGAVTCRGSGLFEVEPCVKVQSGGTTEGGSTALIVCASIAGVLLLIGLVALALRRARKRGSGPPARRRGGGKDTKGASPTRRTDMQESTPSELTGTNRGDISRFDSRFAGSVGAGMRDSVGAGRGRGASGSVLEEGGNASNLDRKPSEAMMRMMETGDEEEDGYDLAGRGIRFSDLGFDDGDVALGGD
jgi:hypothetical protein